MKYINYTIKNDIIFNYLFSHEDILKEFLEACLGKNIQEVEVTNQFSLKKLKYQDKIGVLDIRAKINKDKYGTFMLNRLKENLTDEEISILVVSGHICMSNSMRTKYDSIYKKYFDNLLGMKQPKITDYMISAIVYSPENIKEILIDELKIDKNIIDNFRKIWKMYLIRRKNRGKNTQE